jgi:hypothetical protein
MPPAQCQRTLGARLGSTLLFVAAGWSCSIVNEFDPVDRDPEPPVCEVDPCRAVLPQCGCSDDQMCVLTGGKNACVEPVGDHAVGERCEGLSCEPGSTCIGFDNSSRLCMELCDASSPCRDAGAECAVPLSSETVSACSFACDLLGATGCPDGMKCSASISEGVWFRICVDAGTGGQDDACDRQGDCALGTFCIAPAAGADRACLAWCVRPADDCPTGYVCAGFNTPLLIDDVEMGVCLSSS